MPYIEVTLDDIEIANRLSHQVLGRSLDELAPQTRRLLMLLDKMVTKQCAKLSMERCDYRFTRREVREHTNFGNTRLKIHLHRLEELEYLILHRGGRGQQFVYELAYEGQGTDNTPFMCRLLDISKLKSENYDTNRSPLFDEKSGTGRPQVAPKSRGCRTEGGPVFPNNLEELPPINGKSVKNAHLDESKNRSHVHVSEGSY